ncbi:hypothetical protein OGM63_08925 [Plectonema radiosum NIES-515]|uniref:Uncharacterized protein n=1 Tax=Plectonema radiosum NIES-515 TaxID=2986073 RepID=A0ABT3AX08_9CYAN|nr:hypothetical protein [Plectonema radiosum]MCV3213648.1 hypothetical protein [Plectonema radiosum NIES-515]
MRRQKTAQIITDNRSGDLRQKIAARFERSHERYQKLELSRLHRENF